MVRKHEKINEEYRFDGYSDERKNELYKALCNIRKTEDIGNVLMQYVKENFNTEERVTIIRQILNIWFTDFLTWELPNGELERIRKIISRI